MKWLLALFRSKPPPAPDTRPRDSALFTSGYAGHGVDESVLVPWEARAVEAGARRIAPERALGLLRDLWARDKNMEQLDPASVGRLERFFQFAAVPANRTVIRQNEYGNFMLVLLKGVIAVDRQQPWGEHLRLAETRPGDILGEMSLLDSGIRFSACSTQEECEIGVLTAEAMDDMMASDPRLAAALIALLARKLSLRLRAVSGRFSDRPS